MAARLQITDLDFDTIKSNLIQFLNQQSEFSDYNFQGSALSVLIDLLAYNTHYNAYYLNMIANESFLDTALLRDSVVSHAKLMSYLPASRNAPIATVNITVDSGSTTIDTLIIPRGTVFSSEIIDDYPYNFVTIENHTVTKSNTKYLFENIDLYEGILNSYTFTQDNNSNPKQIFTLPDTNIDTRTLKVSVNENPGSNSNYTTYQSSTNILDLNSSSEAYFLQEGRDQKFEIYFGDDYISKKIADGSKVIASYVITNGTAANKVNTFIPTGPIGGYSDITITSIAAASGGNERESVDSIKFSATKKYSTQNRLVTAKDYAAYIKSNYPGVQSISVWGGEEQTPIVYNKTFIALKLKDGYYLSETEKKRIIDEIVTPKAVIATAAEIVDPNYLYILVEGTINYDSEKTNLSSKDLKTKAINAIRNYNTTYLETFDSRYVQSRLQDDIDNADSSFVGSVIRTKVQRRPDVKLNEYSQYTIDYGIELNRGSLNDRLVSSYFDIFDFQGIRRTARIEEISYSFTGIDSIEIINSGFNFKTIPTITISGDGYGAEAVATISNGKLTAITLTNRGINYTRAFVTITGDGVSASAIANLQGNIGKLRVVYYNELSEAKEILSDAGTIYYNTGIVQTNAIKILSIGPEDGIFRVTAYAKDSVIKSDRDTIVSIDKDSADSILISVEPV
jgi:hypothetical protein